LFDKGFTFVGEIEPREALKNLFVFGMRHQLPRLTSETSIKLTRFESCP
jgi:hypothetical protein